MSWTEKIPVWGVKWLLIALSVLLVLAWLRYAPPTAPWSPHQVIGMVMPEPKVITKIEKVTIPGPARIRVIPKETIVEKIKYLPTAATIQDNGSVVTAVADIPPSPEGGTAIAVLKTTDNVATGSIEYWQKPRKFFQVKRDFYGEGWYYPVGDRQAEAALGVNPLRIGPVEIKAKAGIDLMREKSEIRGFVAVGGEIKF
jgi:hypothetical protein